MENRTTVIRKAIAYVTTAFGGDWKKAFDATDVNGDGQISWVEMCSFLGKADVGFALTRPAIVKCIFGFADIDNNSELSWDEFEKMIGVKPIALDGIESCEKILTKPYEMDFLTPQPQLKQFVAVWGDVSDTYIYIVNAVDYHSALVLLAVKGIQPSKPGGPHNYKLDVTEVVETPTPFVEEIR